METTRIWDSRNNRHATIEHETLRPCPFCGGMPRIYDDVDDTTERYTVRCDCDWYMSDIIAGNKIYTCADPDGLAFAVIESRMFMIWQKAIGGRLKSDPNFSNTVVWNNLPLPALDDDTRAALIEAGKNVLAARANHPGQSLADLYDPDYMPTDLRAAHRELDKVADVAFGARKWLKDDDDTRLQVLFKSYTRMTGSSEV